MISIKHEKTLNPLFPFSKILLEIFMAIKQDLISETKTEAHAFSLKIFILQNLIFMYRLIFYNYFIDIFET